MHTNIEPIFHLYQIWIGSYPSQFIFDNLKEYAILNKDSGQVHFIYDSDKKFITQKEHLTILEFAKKNNIDLIDLNKEEFGDQFLKEVIYEHIDYKNNNKSYGYTKDWILSYIIGNIENSAYFDVDAKVHTSLHEMYKYRNEMGFFSDVIKYNPIHTTKTHVNPNLYQGIFIYNPNVTNIFNISYNIMKKLISEKGFATNNYKKKSILKLTEQEAKIIPYIEKQIFAHISYIENGKIKTIKPFALTYTNFDNRLLNYIRDTYKTNFSILSFTFPQKVVTFCNTEIKTWALDQKNIDYKNKTDFFIQNLCKLETKKEVLEALKDIYPKNKIKYLTFSESISQDKKYINTKHTIYDNAPIYIDKTSPSIDYEYGTYLVKEPNLIFIFTPIIIVLAVVFIKLYKKSH